MTNTIFDGITYAKGGSSLKQVMFLMGEDNFSHALADYFYRFEWDNATIDDFLESMSKYFHLQEFTLQQWKNEWLETASLNQFTLDWKPSQEAGAEIEFKITQSAYCSAHPRLRYHKTEVALFNAKGQVVDTISHLFTPTATTVLKYKQTEAVKAVLFNHNDHTFANSHIDPVSLAFFRNHIGTVEDLLARTQVWYNVHVMVEDGMMRVKELVEMVCDHLFRERANFLVENMLFVVEAAVKANLPLSERNQQLAHIFKKIYQ